MWGGGEYMWRFCGTTTFLGLASPHLVSVFYLWLA